jgi:transcriptional regulatory protein RtcR
VVPELERTILNGRQLFAASRTRKAAPNDADRLRKYLARFGPEWSTVRETPVKPAG